LIKNLLKLFSYNEKIILFFLILIFILFSIFDIFGLYLLSIGISGIFDQNNIYYFYNNLNKININFLTNWSLNSFYLFILIFFLFKNLFFYTFYYWQANFIANVSSSISSKLFEKFLNIDYIKFIKLDIAENSKNLTNDVSRSIQLIGIINIFVKEIFLLLLIVLIMLYVNLNFFLSAITLIIFLLLIFKILYSNKLKNFGNLNQYYTAKQIP
jgi:ABC-type multidrug transport system fused ATPase/permease subunit